MSVGLNKYIDDAIAIFTSDLWTGFNNSFNGRSYRIKNKQGNTIPVIYNGTTTSRDYREVFATDKYDSIVHFDVVPNNELISSFQSNIPVNIFFAVNLGKVYGNDTRAVEQAKADIMNALQYTSFVYDGYLDQDAYSGIYDLTDKQEDQFNMQPYYVIRIQTTIMASLGDCEPSTPIVNYALNISHVGEGVTNPTTNIYSRQAGTSERLTATEEAGNEFVKWTLNAVESFNRILDVVYDGAKTAVATFQTQIIWQDSINILSNIPEEWAQGSILGNGSENTSSIRLKSDYIPIEYAVNSILTTLIAGIYAYTYHEYKGTGGQSDWIDDNNLGYLDINPETTHIRFVAKFLSGAAILPSEAVNFIDTIETNGYYIDEEIEGAIVPYLKVSQFNTGIFNEGAAPAGIPNEDLATQQPIWESLISSLDSSILLMTECVEYFDEDGIIKTYDSILDQSYKYKYFPPSTSPSIFPWPYVASNYIIALRKYIAPSGRTFAIGYVNVNGVRIGLATMHGVPGTGSVEIASRLADNNAIIAYFAAIGYEKIIIGSDTNNASFAELSVFTDDGYTLGNGGAFGEFVTSLYGQNDGKVDNIITKGFTMTSFGVSAKINIYERN